MEQQPIFRDRFEVTEDDLENFTAWTQEGLDHVVLDAIEANRKFTGFGVTSDTNTSVIVSAGRIYVAGERYFDATPGGFPLDLSGVGLKPDLQKRVVSIVISSRTFEDETEERDYETDAEAGTKEPRQVKVVRRRGVRIEAVGGDESVAPKAPVINSTTAVIVATILMGTGGIEKITPTTGARLDNLSEVASRTRSVETWRGVAEPAISGLQAALAALGASTVGQADRKLIFDLASTVAVLQQRVGLPSTYTDFEADPFVDDSLSNTKAIGYDARTEEGLRLPFAAVKETQLGLSNVFDTKVKLTPEGLLLPKYTIIEDRVVRGAAGEISLATYAFEPRSYTKLDFARQRIRYGADYEVSTASAFYLSGTYLGRVNGGVRATFAKDGETFQVYETGKVDADGHRIVRLSKYWYDVTNEPYWSRTSTPSIITGYNKYETFLNKNDRWIVGMAPWIHGKPASGSLTFGICGTYRGEPDFDQVISMTTLEAAKVKQGNQLGPDEMMTPIEPVFLKGGTYYSYFVNTSQNFIHAVADEQNPHSGTYFYELNGGHKFADPGLHLIFSLYSAYFGTTYSEVEMNYLELSGGIQGIDVLASGVTPEGTDLVWKVYVDNVFRTLDEYDANILTTLPPGARLFLGFSGSPDCMPGIKLSGSRVRVSRLKKAGRHISKAKAFPAPINRVVDVSYLSNFDPAHNTITVKVDPGTGLVSPTTIVDEKQIDGTIKRTSTFALAASTSSVVTQIDVVTDSEFRAPVIPTRTRVGTA